MNDPCVGFNGFFYSIYLILKRVFFVVVVTKYDNVFLTNFFFWSNIFNGKGKLTQCVRVWSDIYDVIFNKMLVRSLVSALISQRFNSIAFDRIKKTWTFFLSQNPIVNFCFIFFFILCEYKIVFFLGIRKLIKISMYHFVS